MVAQPVNASLAAGGALPPPLSALFPFNGNSSLSQGLVLPTFSLAAGIRVALTLALCVVATACNVTVLWAGLVGGRSRRSHPRVLLLHLAVADLLVALVVMPLDAAWNVTLEWRAGDGACRLLMFLKLLAMYASAFLTALISLDRQAAILHPLDVSKGWCRNRVLLQAAWMLSAGLSIPQLFLFHTVTIPLAQNFTQCSTQGSFARHWHEVAYNLFSFLCLFLLPLLVMVASCSRILRQISCAGGRESLSSSLRRSRDPLPRARLRMLGLTVAIVGSFLLCWTPYYLLGLWYWFWPVAMEEAISPSLAHLLFVFGFFNACLDPIIYGLFAGGFSCRRARPPSLTIGSSASSLRLRHGPTLLPGMDTAPEANASGVIEPR
nr:gonadotropin-releasing hormone II receptor-like [Anolis sagrei ordinatus]